MMERDRQRTEPSRFWLVIAIFLVCSHFTAAQRSDQKSKTPAIRWAEDRPSCTFSRTDNGKYLYGLWSDDVGVTLAIDSQELEKVRRRHEPFFAALIKVRYRGQAKLEVGIENITLQFLKHFQVIQTSLDPDAFAEKVQTDADEVDRETAREIEKHPDRKDAKQTYARAFQKDTAELIEFVSKNSLRSIALDAGNPEANGWVFFNTNSKWISGWKKEEEFVLRLPLDGKVFEFPFQLPPKPGEVMLRKRD